MPFHVVKYHFRPVFNASVTFIARPAAKMPISIKIVLKKICLTTLSEGLSYKPPAKFAQAFGFSKRSPCTHPIFYDHWGKTV